MNEYMMKSCEDFQCSYVLHSRKNNIYCIGNEFIPCLELCSILGTNLTDNNNTVHFNQTSKLSFSKTVTKTN